MTVRVAGIISLVSFTFNVLRAQPQLCLRLVLITPFAQIGWLNSSIRIAYYLFTLYIWPGKREDQTALRVVREEVAPSPQRESGVRLRKLFDRKFRSTTALIIGTAGYDTTQFGASTFLL